MATIQERMRTKERLRHVTWAGAIALVVSLLGILTPVDQMVWIAQARMAGFEASGDLVFIDAKENLTDPQFPHRREELAQALRQLKRAGARSVYLDMAFEKASQASSDADLNEALRSFDGQTYLVRNLKNSISRNDLRLESNVASVGRGINQVGSDWEFNFVNVVWRMPYSVDYGRSSLVNAAVSIAGTEPGTAAESDFPINYGFKLETIPTARLRTLLDTPAQALSASFQGKTIIIGETGPDVEFNIPGTIGVPGGLLHIYAAETLRAGYVRTIPDALLLVFGIMVLCLATVWKSGAARKIGYAGAVLGVPGIILVTMELGIRPSVSGLVALLMAYLTFRLRSRWKKGLLLVDQSTGLPTFAALTSDHHVARAHPAIIVARMHRFEEVRQSLPPELHAEYILRIIDRLNAAAPETRIYQGPSHEIAWCMAEEEPALIEDHLQGLRALFASPLQVGGEQVDVGITFGVDLSPSTDVTRRLANAVAAAERTTETYLPILIAEAKSDEELIWNISLQGRIDAALAQDEIFLAYQPKIRTDTGEMVGMEALVRWRDPVRGMIPPDSFIRQCETTGRMSHLTRYVLLKACLALKTLPQGPPELSIAVNISATLLHDREIVGMVREVLAETGIDPHRLVLEITETFRISDMTMARANLQTLADIGIPVSMDDFGVGAASLEALMRLPFSEIKIDRLFIDRVGQDPKAMAIVRSILELGRSLRISVVGEGVEDAATLQLLRSAGCTLAQGFGICRPVSFEEAVRFGDKAREGAIRISV